MVLICPYCDIEISEKLVEAEDGCCPECGTLITARSVAEQYEDEENNGDIYEEDEYANEFNDEDFPDNDEYEEDFNFDEILGDPALNVKEITPDDEDKEAELSSADGLEDLLASVKKSSSASKSEKKKPGKSKK